MPATASSPRYERADLWADLLARLGCAPDADPATRGLIAFACATFPGYRPAPHHRKIAEALEAVAAGDTRRLMIFMPPRHGKSELASIRYPAWYLGRMPDRRIIAASYAASLAYRFSRQARGLLTLPAFRRWFPAVTVSGDAAAVQQWDIAGRRGGYLAVGVGGPLTGQGANLLLIDDPIKSREEADSPTVRDSVWDWYQGTAYTRLEEDAAIVLVQCMTGDTPVRLADGSERPLRDIRPGDRVATYQLGRLATSTVLHHTSQGYDNIYAIRMTSGRVVRANERHPFLVDEGGRCRWIRLRDLTTGHRIVTVRGSGGSGAASFAPSRAASSRSLAVASVNRTTSRRCGQTGIVPRPSTRRHTASATSSIGTGSPPPSMTPCWPRRTVGAPFAGNHHLTRTHAPTGASNSASITIMRPGPCGDCFATTATWPSAMPSPKRPHGRWSNTSDFTTEQIASIEPAGVAEVFDVQIAGTENFIANGLVSHNTRWHADDLAGRLLREQAHGGERWEVLSLPAVAEAADPLGRAPGDALWPEKYDATELARIKLAVGSRNWQALYQQSPTSDEGGLFKRHWWARFGAFDRASARRIIQSWDTAFQARETADYSVCSTWAETATGVLVVDVWRGQVDFPDLKRKARDLYEKWRPSAVLIEDKASGQSLIQELRRETALPVIPVAVDKDKVSRANAVTPYVEAQRVALPAAAPWVDDWIEEHAAFPLGEHDDQVDTTSMALARLMAEQLPFAWRRNDADFRERVLGTPAAPADPAAARIAAWKAARGLA